MEISGHTGPNFLLSSKCVGLGSSCLFCEYVPSSLPQTPPFPAASPTIGQVWISIYHLTYNVFILFSFVIELRKKGTIAYTQVMIENKKRNKGSRKLHMSCPQYALLTYSTSLTSISICIYLLWCVLCLPRPQTMLAFRIFSGCHPLLEELDVRRKQWALFKLTFLLLPKLNIAHHQLLVEIISVVFLNCLQM